jgi:hypothetical protein
VALTQDDVTEGWFVRAHARYLALIAVVEEARVANSKSKGAAKEPEDVPWPQCSDWKAAKVTTQARSDDKRVTYGYDAVVCPVRIFGKGCDNEAQVRVLTSSHVL